MIVHLHAMLGNRYRFLQAMYFKKCVNKNLIYSRRRRCNAVLLQNLWIDVEFKEFDGNVEEEYLGSVNLLMSVI